MAFCEQCGAKLTPGTRFCEECGVAVELPDDVFSSDGWKDNWLRCAEDAGDAELGLIVTREKTLMAQLDGSADEYRSAIDAYRESTERRGVVYHYLNLDACPFAQGGDLQSVVGALREIVDVARPKYLLILGNEDVIDVAVWENEADNNDEEVESDLPYATLCTDSPWEKNAFDYDAVMRVGRLPTYEGESVAQFVSYFQNAADVASRHDRVVPYGLSALVWQVESDAEFAAVSSRKVDVSPAVTKANVKSRMGFESNLLFFNLHGSDQTKFWYGQEGSSYPEAFEPHVLTDMDHLYFIGVEACYGARYLGGLTPDDSIVLKALQNRCVALLGSSRIAFGASVPKGSCADVVIGTYIRCLNDGFSAGDAHVEGLKNLCADPYALDDTDIKTLAEFALYGDPSARVNAAAAKSFGMGSQSSRSGVARGLVVPMPDVRRAVHLAVCEIDAKIEALIDGYIRKELLQDLSDDAFEAAEQKTYRVRDGLNQKIVSVRQGVLPRIAKVYFDEQGAIKKAIVSK